MKNRIKEIVIATMVAGVSFSAWAGGGTFDKVCSDGTTVAGDALCPNVVRTYVTCNLTYSSTKLRQIRLHQEVDTFNGKDSFLLGYTETKASNFSHTRHSAVRAFAESVSGPYRLIGNVKEAGFDSDIFLNLLSTEEARVTGNFDGKAINFSAKCETISHHG